MKITLIMPTFNEAENLPKIVPALFALPLDLKIMVIDDNSPDGTGQLAEELAEAYPGRMSVYHREKKLGLGTAYVMGFRLALEEGADVVGQMDSDFSHPVEKLIEMDEHLEQGDCDVVIGSRYVSGGSVDLNWPFWRKALSAWGSFYARTILGLKLRDATGGFRLFTRRVIESLPLDRIKSNGYVFQIEVAYLMHRMGFRAVEIPIYFADRKWGQSKMSFKIQMEAAIRTWLLLFDYNDVGPVAKN
ncbi:MAG: polyprenol monophosphomannose synthase [Anaerolineales bacterium]|nr:polyprenol monophosphomannose synthase [Anaerolineales bacterium]